VFRLGGGLIVAIVAQRAGPRSWLESNANTEAWEMVNMEKPLSRNSADQLTCALRG
jgi:hypothetical protein